MRVYLCMHTCNAVCSMIEYFAFVIVSPGLFAYHLTPNGIQCP